MELRRVMRVHVIGGSGFLGSRVVARLVSERHEVTGLARSERAAQHLRDLGAEPMPGNLEDPTSVTEAMTARSPHVLVTSVSLGTGYGPPIVEAAEKAGARRGVFVSTTSIFTKLSARSKEIRLEAEERIRSSSLQWTIVRPTMIYGAPDDRNMARLLRWLARWRVLPLPLGGRALQQPVHVDDLSSLIVSCLDSPIAIGKTYEAPGPTPLPLRTIVRQASQAIDRRVWCVPAPLQPVVALVRAYERLGGRGLRAEQLERLAEDKVFDHMAARTDLGFEPRAFAEGIREEAIRLGLRTPAV